MRIVRTTLAVSAAILTALVIGSSDVCHAQAQLQINIAPGGTIYIASEDGYVYSLPSLKPMGSA